MGFPHATGSPPGYRAVEGHIHSPPDISPIRAWRAQLDGPNPSRLSGYGGAIAEERTFPPSREISPPRMQMFAISGSRFRERDAKAGRKDASELWREAPDQVEMGWLSHSIPVMPSAKPDGWAETGYRVDFSSALRMPRNFGPVASWIAARPIRLARR